MNRTSSSRISLCSSSAMGKSRSHRNRRHPRTVLALGDGVALDKSGLQYLPPQGIIRKIWPKTYHIAEIRTIGSSYPTWIWPDQNALFESILMPSIDMASSRSLAQAILLLCFTLMVITRGSNKAAPQSSAISNQWQG